MSVDPKSLKPGQKVKVRYTDDNESAVVVGILKKQGHWLELPPLLSIANDRGDLCEGVEILEVSDPGPFGFLEYEDLDEVEVVDVDDDRYTPFRDRDGVLHIGGRTAQDHLDEYGPLRVYRVERELITTLEAK